MYSYLINMKVIHALLFFTLSISVLADEIPRYWDFNADGKEDIWYEYSELSYLLNLDRNYDGVVDLHTQYDSHTDWPLSGASDDDFDGSFETRHAYKNGTIYAYLVDSNQDQCYDIVHYYHHEVIFKSKRYENLKGKKIITIVNYKLDFPVSSETKETSITPCEFHKSEVSKIPSIQNMPTKESNP
tara:strand:- start:1058 stop:1615 length:558 start_codon:yes stop_codon:yes gene_type:complete